MAFFYLLRLCLDSFECQLFNAIFLVDVGLFPSVMYVGLL